MAYPIRRVWFHCPVCQLQRSLSPGVAGRRKACSRRCGGVLSARIREAKRLQRVRFVYGYSASEARAYLHGWKLGRDAAGKLRSYKRAVGSAAWEQAS
jgi:hypothetical protein